MYTYCPTKHIDNLLAQIALCLIAAAFGSKTDKRSVGLDGWNALAGWNGVPGWVPSPQPGPFAHGPGKFIIN
jgi:hypothetical protein